MANEDNGAPDGQPGGNTAEVSMSQARFDSIINERVIQAKRSATVSMCAELGFDSFELLKAFVSKSRTDAQTFETERQAWATEKATLQASATDAMKQFETLTLKIKQSSLEKAILAEAQKPDYKIEPAALKTVMKLIDLKSIKEKEDGTFEGIDAAVKAMVAENAFLVTPSAGPRGTPRVPQGGPKQSEQARTPARKL